MKKLGNSILILWLGTAALAQEYSFSSSLLGMKDGLPDNNVNCMVQDHLGLMWLGTRNGLCSYDGFYFVKYPFETGEGTSHNYVRSLHETDNRFLWIGTNGGGLNLYDQRREKFIHFPFIYTDSVMVESNVLDRHLPDRIYSIASRKPGELWVGSQSGLYRLEYSMGEEISIKRIRRYRALRDDPNSLCDNKVFHLMFDSKGQLWISSNEGGLSCFKPDGERFENFYAGDKPNDLPGNQIMYTMEDSQGRIWVGTWERGLARYREESGDFVSFQSGSLPGNLSGNNIYKLCEDNAGHLWIGAIYDGLDRLDLSLPGEAVFHHHWEEDGSNNLVNSNVILALYCSSDGVIWASMQGLGVYRIYSQKNYFTRHKAGNDQQSLSGNDVTAIAIDYRKRFWIGTWEQGLNVAEFANDNLKVLKKFHRRSLSLPLQSDSVYAVLPDHEDQVWVGLWGGLDRVVTRNGSFRVLHVPLEINGENEYRINVNTLHQDIDSMIWVGTEEKGLFYVDRKAGVMRSYRELEGFSPSDSRLNSPKINCLYSCPSVLPGVRSELWVGTYNGVTRLLFGEESIESMHYYALSQGSGLPGNDIKNFTRRGDDLWIGTSQGMCIFHLGNNRFSDDQLLPGEYIMSVLPDSAGNLWIGNVAGLTFYNPANGTRKQYLEHEYGIIHGYNHNAASLGEDGQCFFGTNRGVMHFAPGSMEQGYKSRVVFTNLKVNQEKVQAGKPGKGRMILKRSIRETEQITLNHSQSTFSIEFSSDNYQESENNQFAYRLKGLQEAWTQTSAERAFVDFAKLHKGNYTLEVKTAGADGVWSPNMATLAITVMPPPWKTWWAYTIYGLMVLGLLYVFRNMIARRIKLQEAIRFEKFKREKEEELNQQRLQFFTNISHELRTPLTLISGPLEQVINTAPEDMEMKERLQVIRNNSNKLLNLINQLLDFRKLEMGKEQLAASETDLVALSRQIFDQFRLKAGEDKIDYTFKSKLERTMVWLDSDKYDKILVNLLSNAFKYTPPGGKVSLQIRERTLSSRYVEKFNLSFGKLDMPACVEIRIRDTGPGIPESEIEGIFERFYRVKGNTRKRTGNSRVEGSGIGLSFVKQLVLIHHGQLGVRTKEGEGSSFVIRLPLGSEHLNQAELADDEKPVMETLAGTPDLPVFTGYGDKRILVVEDNVEMRDFITGILSPHYRVMEAENGMKGLEVALEKAPDLIISDVMMPEMDGVELCNRIKGNLETSHIPLLLLTALSTLEHNIEGLEAGADDYISKPFSPEAFLLRIRNRFETREKLTERYRSDLQLNHREIVTSRADDGFMEKLMAFIDENLDDPDLDVDRFVDEFGMSRSTCNRKLKQITGQGPAEFLNMYRMKVAARLLLKKEQSVKEIAWQVGFNDSRYFATRFKKHFNLTPTQYQDQGST
ncbi:MAG: two-component regulator propeller domain-containing protein [Bacteroidota bacterium]